MPDPKRNRNPAAGDLTSPGLEGGKGEVSRSLGSGTGSRGAGRREGPLGSPDFSCGSAFPSWVGTWGDLGGPARARIRGLADRSGLGPDRG